eukprot:scaffold2616_cov88-Amphora_coffeaeformis.AAC.2
MKSRTCRVLVGFSEESTIVKTAPMQLRRRQTTESAGCSIPTIEIAFFQRLLFPCSEAMMWQKKKKEVAPHRMMPWLLKYQYLLQYSIPAVLNAVPSTLP